MYLPSFVICTELRLTPPRQAVQRMCRRYSVSVAGRYSVGTAEAILDNCCTELVFYGLSCEND